jgi:hypothetical protein
VVVSRQGGEDASIRGIARGVLAEDDEIEGQRLEAVDTLHFPAGLRRLGDQEPFAIASGGEFFAEAFVQGVEFGLVLVSKDGED